MCAQRIQIVPVERATPLHNTSRGGVQLGIGRRLRQCNAVSLRSLPLPAFTLDECGLHQQCCKVTRLDPQGLFERLHGRWVIGRGSAGGRMMQPEWCLAGVERGGALQQLSRFTRAAGLHGKARLLTQSRSRRWIAGIRAGIGDR